MTLQGPAHPEQFRTTVGRYRERWYVDPLPGCDIAPSTDEPFPSVTTIKGAWPKFLTTWAAKAVAVEAVDTLDQWAKLDRDAAVDHLAAAPNRSRDKAAARGTEIHRLLEMLAEGQAPMPALIPDAEPYLPALEALVTDLDPTWVLSEVVAINREVGYGGTLDAVITSEALGGTFVVDWKTRAKHGAYDDEACQVGGAYAGAEYVIVEDGGEAKRMRLPKLDGALIVSITPDGYRLHPVDIDKAVNGFKTLRQFWAVQQGRDIVGRPLHVAPVKKTAPIEFDVAAYADDLGDVMLAQERHAWIVGRVDTIKTAGHLDDLVNVWPANTPTPSKVTGTYTATQIDAIAKACSLVEKRHQMPFGDGDPAKVTEAPPWPEVDEGNLIVAPDDDRVKKFRERIGALPDEIASDLKKRWKGPRLNGGTITEAQLADFGVLLAAAEARAVFGGDAEQVA